MVGELWHDYGLVFPSERGTSLDPRNLLRQFKELPDMRFHDLRYSCATTLISQGVHLRVVQEILGHSQISTSMNVYGHVLDATRRVAADVMDGIFLADKPEEPDETKELHEPPASEEATAGNMPPPPRRHPKTIREALDPGEGYTYAAMG